MDILNNLTSTTDPYSFSNPEEARVIDTDLELNVDFNLKVLKGKAILTIERKPSINEITLDILGLDIKSVTNELDGTHLYYKDSFDFESLLRIDLPRAVDITSNSECQIQIEYETNPNSRALHWLTPAQTANGLHPFLLSNNKFIYAREWFPCQDTPSVKFTYTARILVRKHFRVLMSALLHEIEKGPELDVYKFRQDNPVPSYAVVIAVGSLPTKSRYNERVIMFAERYNSYIDQFPLATIEEMLQIAESLCGPYLWGKYVICVLPPSIAHFEIECPCVTFISWTILGADRSHISKYIARNISQSWAGNLITCVNWDHLWLNKSFSIFISRKIICQTSGLNNMKNFLRKEGLRNLNLMIENPRNVGLLNCLVPNLTDTLPHDATKYVPYERGCMLLDDLENILGGPLVFEPFLQSYFDRFARQSINTKDWMDYLCECFPEKKEEFLDCAKSWFLIIPSISNVPSRSSRSSLEEDCFQLANPWVEWNCDAYPYCVPSNLTDRISHLCDVQKIIFLNYLHSSHKRLTDRKLADLSRFFHHTTNGEIRFLWLLLCIKVQWDDKVTPALNFAIEYCSPNYACPIFQHLCEWNEEVRQRAIEKYNKNSEKMLAKTRELLNVILLMEQTIEGNSVDGDA